MTAIPGVKGRDRKRLLVIDDEQSICDFVRRVAEGEGYEVATALTHAQFKAAYESFRPSASSHAISSSRSARSSAVIGSLSQMNAPASDDS